LKKIAGKGKIRKKNYITLSTGKLIHRKRETKIGCQQDKLT